MVKVPYKGGVPAVNDLIGGQVDLMISDAYPVAQFIKTGKLRALAITSPTRSALVPGVPTFAELGQPGVVAMTWWGVFLPAGVPTAIQDQYSKALIKIMNDADIKENFANLSVEAVSDTQEEFKAFLAAETARYGKLIADNNIKGE